MSIQKQFKLESKQKSKQKKVIEFDSAIFCANLPKKTGVYRMYDSSKKLLYIGKAVNLKSRVSSYFNKIKNQNIKTQVMVKKIKLIEISFCETETEALILEQNLIKKFKPRYNITLKDNKSYPYLLISCNEEFPAIRFRRNINRLKKKEQLFGPYPSADELKKGISLISKIFRLRDCSNTEFKNRSRACLKYQIKRCSAPCVGLISKEDYQSDVRSASYFLQNKNANIIKDLTQRMDLAAKQLDFEQAALIRDQIRSLKSLNQSKLEGNQENIDMVVFQSSQGYSIAHILTIRKGKIGMDYNFYFNYANFNDSDNSLFQLNFLNQYYLSNLTDFPNQVFIKKNLTDLKLLEKAILAKNNKNIIFKQSMRSFIKLNFSHAEKNATNLLNRYLEKKSTYQEKLVALKDLLEIDSLERFECYDVSHTFGSKTTGSLVVFDDKGVKKSQYRIFNLSNHQSDDLKAMNELLTRRINHSEWKFPNLWLIDGGMTHYKMAQKLLRENNLNQIKLIAVAKGKTRKDGFENLIFEKNGVVVEQFLNSADKALHLIQYIRNESHRFAITHHRKRRIKAQKSVLDLIEGIGEVKRKTLLLYFSDINGIKRASLEELLVVRGINKHLSQKIYDFFQLKSELKRG